MGENFAASGSSEETDRMSGILTYVAVPPIASATAAAL